MDILYSITPVLCDPGCNLLSVEDDNNRRSQCVVRVGACDRLYLPLSRLCLPHIYIFV